MDMRHAINLAKRLTEADAANSTRSASFRRWFGNSKVVDVAGQPMPVFHGGKKGIKVFGDSYRRTLQWAEETGFKLSDVEKAVYGNPAHFFTDDPSVAEGYADQHDYDEQAVYEVYLRIEKPLDLRPDVAGRDDVSEAISTLLGVGKVLDSEVDDRDMQFAISHAIRGAHAVLRERSALMGHDGIIMPDTCVRDRSLHTSYVVFSSNQIKTVDNTSFELGDDITV